MQPSLIQQLHVDSQATKVVTILGHENSGRTSFMLKIALALQEVTTAC
jgi:ABC-type branched-subunit amino acid transport system ATPase component